MVSTAAFHARVRGSVPGLGGLKETKLFLPHPRVKVSIVGSLRDREVACSASDRQGSNFESCVRRTVSSQSSHHPQEVLLTRFSLYTCAQRWPKARFISFIYTGSWSRCMSLGVNQLHESGWVWILRPRLVCVPVLSAFALLLWAVFLLLRTPVGVFVSVQSIVVSQM